MLINIIAWLIFGAVVGWLATLIVSNDSGGSLLGDIAVGLIGALVGGFIAYFLTGRGVEGISLWSFLWSFIGAVVLMLVFKSVRRAL